MDILLLYVLVASMTPLFLWIEHRKLALIQLPLIVGTWGYFVIEFASMNIGTFGYISLLSLFVANLLFSHIAIYLVLFHDHFIRDRMTKAPYVMNAAKTELDAE